MADQSLLQYLAEQLGGVPTDAASRLLFASSRDAQQARLGQPRLTYEQQLAGDRQGLSPGDMGKVRYEGGKWLNVGNGQPYTSRGNRFDYSHLMGAPGGPKLKNDNVWEDQDHTQQPPPPPPADTPPAAPPPPPPTATRTPGTPPPGGIPGTTQVPGATYPGPQDPPPPPPPPPDPNAPPPRNPVTTPPAPMRPPTGTGATSWVSSPLKSFDPTQLLMALRGVTQGGALAGPNAVQSNLPSYLAQAMKSRNA